MGKFVYCEKYVQGSTRPAQHLAVHQVTLRQAARQRGEPHTARPPIPAFLFDRKIDHARRPVANVNLPDRTR